MLDEYDLDKAYHKYLQIQAIMSQTPQKPLRYHHFLLLVWEERDDLGRHVTWRFSLRDSQKEKRIGFKNLAELTAYLEQWMKDSSDFVTQD
jgi:hypothetical protein